MGAGPLPGLRLVAMAGLGLLAGCSSLLPSEREIETRDFASYAGVEAAFERVVPMATRASELSRLGFDVGNTASVERLSYLGVMEHFMPRDAIRLEDTDPAVRSCILRRELCTGYRFQLERREEERVGNVALDLLSFNRTTVTSGWNADVIFLVDGGLVTYKLLSGNPSVDRTHERVQPLGPLQDLTGAAASMTIDAVTP
jgi:hypothetical protein